MSVRNYDFNEIGYSIDDIGFRSDISKVTFEYEGESNGVAEDLAHQFNESVSRPIKIFGVEIHIFKPEMRQDGNSVYLPHIPIDKAEETVERYLEDFGDHI